MKAEPNENEKCVYITVEEFWEKEKKTIKHKYEDALVYKISLGSEEFRKQHQFLIRWQIWCIENGYSLKVI